MLQFLHIQQECPICGRPLRVRSEHVGRWVSCDHFSGKFVARECISGSDRRQKQIAENRSNRLLRRADELLVMCGERLGSSCCPECQATH